MPVASENFQISLYLLIQLYNHFTASKTSHHCSVLKHDIQRKREKFW